MGRLYLPKTLFEHLETGPLVVLETPMEERVSITFEEYVERAQEDFAKAFPDAPLQAWHEAMQAALDRIRKRLGGQRHAEVSKLLEDAVGVQRELGEKKTHRAWIAYLLEHYYDPMYDYQIEKRRERVLFRGGKEEVLQRLRELA